MLAVILSFIGFILALIVCGYAATTVGLPYWCMICIIVAIALNIVAMIINICYYIVQLIMGKLAAAISAEPEYIFIPDDDDSGGDDNDEN